MYEMRIHDLYRHYSPWGEDLKPGEVIRYEHHCFFSREDMQRDIRLWLLEKSKEKPEPLVDDEEDVSMCSRKEWGNAKRGWVR